MGAPVTYRKRDFETALDVAHSRGLTITGAEIDRKGTIKLKFDGAVENDNLQSDELDDFIDEQEA